MPLKYKNIGKMNTGGEVDDDSADTWEQIKNFVGGANKQPKHPLIQEAERMKMRKPQHLDEGGIAGADPGLLDGLTPGDSTQAPINVPHGTLPNVPAATPPLSQSVAPTTSMGTSPVTSPVTTPTTPTQVFDDKASSVLGGMTPDAIKAYVNNVIQGNKRSLIGAGFAGLGDAIASVGGSNPGHLKATMEGIQQNKELAMKLPEQMATMGKEKYTLSKELQADAADSPFSRVKQNAERSFLKTLGFSDDDISSIPASSIDGLRSGALTRDDVRQRIQSEADLKKMGFGLQKEQIEATKTHQAEETKQNAAKALSDRGVIKTAMDAIPFTTGNAAKKVLEKQAAGEPQAQAYAPDVTAYAQKHGITPDQALQIKMKRTGGQ